MHRQLGRPPVHELREGEEPRDSNSEAVEADEDEVDEEQSGCRRGEQGL